MKQTRKRILSILAAAAMVFCTLLGGTLPQTVSAAADKTVYITAESVSGTPGSRVPVTVDIRSESAITLMSLSLLYDSAMPPVPADPAEPNVPKAEVDLRSSAYAEPTDELLDLTVKPNKSYLHIASNTAFRWGRITVWFDIPEDAAVGTKYPLDLQADVLLGAWLTTKLSGALTGGTITVTDQPAETTPPPAQVEAAFDITEETLLLEVNTSGETFEIAYTASQNLDYIEWRSDNVRIGVDKAGYLYNFNFPDDATYVIGAVTATAHFLDGTVLTDTVSVYARDRRNLIEIPDVIGDPVIVDLLTEPVTTSTTAKATVTTAKAVTTTAPATTRTEKATTTTAKAMTTTAKATATKAKVTTTTAKATTTTAKAAATTAKVTTTTAKATTTTAKATTTTAKVTTTTATAMTTTAKATTTKAKVTTTTAKATTTTAKATTTTAKVTTTTAKAAATTAKAATTTAKVTTTTAKATTTTAKAAATTAKATTTTAKVTTTTAKATTTLLTETTPAVTTAAAPAPLRGDVNEDGEVSVDDAQLALRAYTNRIAGNDMGLTERQIQAANVNGDAELSVDDAQNILKYYTQKTVAGNDITWDDILGKKAKKMPRLIKKKIRL